MKDSDGKMTYKEFVNKPLMLRRKVEHKIEDVQLKWTICQSATANMDGEKVQGSFQNRTENSLLMYIDAKRELDELAGELEESRDAVRSFFYDNLTERDADILEWRYINGRNLKEIADIVGVQYQTMKNQMSEANRNAYSKYQLLVDSMS